MQIVKSDNDVCYWSDCHEKPDYVIHWPGIDDYYFSCCWHTMEVLDEWEKKYGKIASSAAIASYEPFWKSR